MSQPSQYIKEPKHKGLEDLRGMSEPFAFSFNINKRNPHGALLVHAVIFTSYEVGDNEQTIHLCTPEDDPRMGPFINFCIDNYGKSTKEKLQEHILQASRQLDHLKREFNALNKKINEAKHHAKP